MDLDQFAPKNNKKSIATLVKKPKLLLEAIGNNPFNIKYVPKEYLTTDLIKCAVSKIGIVINCIEDPTDEIYEAVEPLHGLPFIPDKFKTKEKCIAYLSSPHAVSIILDESYANVNPIELAKNVPEHFYCEEFFLEVAKRGMLLRIPLEYRTDEVIYAALTADPDNLGYVDNPSDDMCFYAINLDPHVIHHVKEQTDDMKWCAIKAAIGNKKSKPTKKHTHDWYKMRSSPILDHIHDPTDEMIIECLKADGENIMAIRNPPLELIELALDTSITAITFVEQTEEVCWLALKRDPLCISLITRPTKEMFSYAFSGQHLEKAFLSCFYDNLDEIFEDDLQYYLDICKLALERDPLLYLEVHMEAREELTELAFSMYPDLKEKINALMTMP